MNSTRRQVQAKVDALSKRDETDFSVLRSTLSNRPDPDSALLLVIHPGVAIERAGDWFGQAGGKEVVALSLSNQAGMAVEINDKLDSHDVVVLHRLSSTHLRAAGVQGEYAVALDRCDQKGTIL